MQTAGDGGTRVYPLSRALLANQPVAENDLAELLDKTFPMASAQVGGFLAMPGAILVNHTPDTHAAVAELLETVSKLDADPLATRPVTLGSAARDDQVADDWLQRRGDFAYNDANLRDVLLDVAERFHLSVSVHTPIDSLRVTCRVRDQTLGTFLRELPVVVDVCDEALVVLGDEAGLRQYVRVYPVGDLLAPKHRRDEQALCEVATQHLRHGHLGHVGHFAGQLVVRQSRLGHRQLESLLDDLRRTLRIGNPPPNESALRRERIEAALGEPAELEFHDAPLTDVVATLCDQFGIPVTLHAKALHDAGIAADSRITLPRTKGPRSVLLRRLLAERELSYLITDDGLQVTTPDFAKTLETRVFRIPRFGSVDCVEAEYAPASLVQALDFITWPTWGDGAEASAFGDALVVTQTPDVLAQVEATLNTLNEARRQPDGEPVEVDWADSGAIRFARRDAHGQLVLPEDRLVHWIFPIADLVADKELVDRTLFGSPLGKLIISINPKSWSFEDGPCYFEEIHRCLLVEAPRQQQQQVWRLLQAVRQHRTANPGPYVVEISPDRDARHPASWRPLGEPTSLAARQFHEMWDELAQPTRLYFVGDLRDAYLQRPEWRSKDSTALGRYVNRQYSSAPPQADPFEQFLRSYLAPHWRDADEPILAVRTMSVTASRRTHSRIERALRELRVRGLATGSVEP